MKGGFFGGETGSRNPHLGNISALFSQLFQCLRNRCHACVLGGVNGRLAGFLAAAAAPFGVPLGGLLVTCG